MPTDKRTEQQGPAAISLDSILHPDFASLDTGSPMEALAIEDDPGDYAVLERALRGAQIQLSRAGTLAEGLGALCRKPFHVVLLDLRLPDSSGLEGVLTLTAEAPHHAVVVLTGLDDEETGVAALKAGAQDYLSKSSLGRGFLLRSIRYAIERKRQEDRLIHLNSVLQSIRSIHRRIQTAVSARGLAESVCDSVVRYRGYPGAWMFLAGKEGNVAAFVRAGAGPDYDPANPDETLLRIVRAAVKTDNVLHTDAETCSMGGALPLVQSGTFRCAWFRLVCEGRLFGVMGVRTPGSTPLSREETELLREAAADISFALYGLEERSGRAQAEQALRRSEARYSLLFNKGNDAILVHRLEKDGTPGRIIDANDIACERYGYTREELLRMTPEQLAAPRESSPEDLWERLVREGQALFELDQQTRDGRMLPVEINAQVFELDGRPTVLSIIRDISDRRRVEAEKEALERQLLRAQRMEAIGKLAGGVAHDFNNLLSAIFGWSEMASDLLPPGHTALEMLTEIQKAGKKAATVTRQLLAMSRRQLMRLEPLDINNVVADMDKMLRRLIGEDIALVSDLGSRLFQVRADAGQLEQVLLNLAVNARDAMPSGGRLHIATSNVTLDEVAVRRHADLSPGPHVLLRVSDTGCGMDLETMTRAFEPFFTTKANEHGTGLGLSTVYGIVKQLDGDITIDSKPGKGTTFSIYLPAFLGESGAPKPGGSSVFLEPLRGSETVLLVEDDESVRVVARRILEQCGYTVLQAEGFDDAISLHEEHAGRVRLLLTDVILRGWSGKELADYLVSQDAGLKVLFMSGYTDDKLARHGVLESDQALIHKPFTLQSMARKVREVLNGT